MTRKLRVEYPGAIYHNWNDHPPVAGQQFDYSFDDIGNRRTATRDTRLANYTVDLLNQSGSRTVPGFANVVGGANPNADVWVNSQPTERKGSYFRKELPLANSAGAVWQGVTVRGVLSGLDATSQGGSLFLPRTPEVFTYDQDGNQTSDGHWMYTWDAENRL